MYAITVTVTNLGTGRAALLCYGPYQSRRKAEAARLALGEQARCAPGGIDVEAAVTPLVRFGLPDAAEDAALQS